MPTDKERLDWFDVHRPFVHHIRDTRCAGGFRFSLDVRSTWDAFEGSTIREAIDAAIAADEQEETHCAATAEPAPRAVEE